MHGIVKMLLIQCGGIYAHSFVTVSIQFHKIVF